MKKELERCEFHNERWKLIFVKDQFGVVGQMVPRFLLLRPRGVKLRILRHHSSVLDWRADSICVEELEIVVNPKTGTIGQYFRLHGWDLYRLADSYFQIVEVDAA